MIWFQFPQFGLPGCSSSFCRLHWLMSGVFDSTCLDEVDYLLCLDSLALGPLGVWSIYIFTRQILGPFLSVVDSYSALLCSCLQNVRLRAIIKLIGLFGNWVRLGEFSSVPFSHFFSFLCLPDNRSFNGPEWANLSRQLLHWHFFLHFCLSTFLIPSSVLFCLSFTCEMVNTSDLPPYLILCYSALLGISCV